MSDRGTTRGTLQAVALLLAAKGGKRTVHVASQPALAWEVLKFTARTLGIDVHFYETDRIANIDSSVGSVRVVGPDDEDKLRGREFDAAVVDRRTESIDRLIVPRLSCLSPRGWVVYVDEAISTAAVSVATLVDELNRSHEPGGWWRVLSAHAGEVIEGSDPGHWKTEPKPDDAAVWRRRAEALASYVLGLDDRDAAGARHIVVGGFSAGLVWEPDGPRPETVRPGRPASPNVLRDAITARLQAAIDRHDNDSIHALADALRAVEGR